MNETWKSRRGKDEYIYYQVSEYMKTNHPGVIFSIDLTVLNFAKKKWVVVNYIRPHRLPKLFIPTPNKRYKGLFIEILADGSKSLLADGTAKNPNGSISRAEANMKILNKSGYRAVFTIGFKKTVNEIENYIKL